MKTIGDIVEYLEKGENCMHNTDELISLIAKMKSVVFVKSSCGYSVKGYLIKDGSETSVSTSTKVFDEKFNEIQVPEGMGIAVLFQDWVDCCMDIDYFTEETPTNLAEFRKLFADESSEYIEEAEGFYTWCKELGVMAVEA